MLHSASLVQKDWNTAVAQAVEMQDEELLGKHRELWATRAQQFWKDNTVDASVAKENAMKPERRLKAKAWLLSTDRAMQTSCDCGWAQYVISEEQQSSLDPGDWPVAHVAMDQGTDGWSACNWLMFGARTCLMVFKDPMHRLWNDSLNSIKESGLWPLCLQKV